MLHLPRLVLVLLLEADSGLLERVAAAEGLLGKIVLALLHGELGLALPLVGLLLVLLPALLQALLEWRAGIEFDGPVYAGVMVVPSAAMARKITADIPQLAVPDEWLRAIERDPSAGVELACDLVAGVRASGAFDGVHLIPVSRYREVAARLEGHLSPE